MKKKIGMAVITFLFVTSWSFGYIDPGTGSYLIQFLLAAVAGGGIGRAHLLEKYQRFFFPQTASREQTTGGKVAPSRR